MPYGVYRRNAFLIHANTAGTATFSQLTTADTPPLIAPHTASTTLRKVSLFFHA